MPNRMLRDYTDSESVNRLSWQAECLFVRLIMKADDYGRYYGDAQLLKSYLFPRRNIRATDMSRWIAECENAGLIACYPGADGKTYAVIKNFNQRMRAKESKFPAPPNVNTSHDRQTNSEQPGVTEEPMRANPGITLATIAPMEKPAPLSGVKDEMSVTCQSHDSHMTARDERRETKKETTSLKKVSLRDEEAEAEKSSVVPDKIPAEDIRIVQAVEKLAAAYPKRFAMEAGKRSALKVLKRLIDGSESLKEAETRLLEVVKNYAVFYRDVPDSKKRYTWSMEKFFESGHYDDDPAFWNLSDDENDNETPDVFRRLDAKR